MYTGCEQPVISVIKHNNASFFINLPPYILVICGKPDISYQKVSKTTLRCKPVSQKPCKVKPSRIGWERPARACPDWLERELKAEKT
jgi:hypothetical protein